MDNSAPDTSPQRYLIVGLGNPGPTYEHTRHNAGFMLVERLCELWGGRFQRVLRKSLTCATRLGQNEIILAKPQTFMNLSGQAVVELLNRYQFNLSQLLVVYDEVALPLGKIRLRRSGSAGGHNGMKSIISWLGSQEFARLRIGIAPPEPPDDLSNYVLDNFRKKEREELLEILENACQAVRTFLEEGPEQAMARFN